MGLHVDLECAGSAALPNEVFCVFLVCPWMGRNSAALEVKDVITAEVDYRIILKRCHWHDCSPTFLKCKGLCKRVLVYFPYFENMKIGLCDLHALCVSVYSSPSTFQWLNQYL
jgi:hypothetical protein